MKNYEGKVFVITGATGGIGSAMCKRFAPKKLRFYLLDLPNSNFQDLEDELMKLGAKSVEHLECDVTNHEQIKEVVNYIGEKEKYIDILVNNAGIGNNTSITNGGTIEDLRKIISINVEGPWVMTQEALLYLGRPVKKPPKKNPKQREGQVIFISSSAGKFPVANMTAYTASKHAVIGMAGALRQELILKNEKIHIITICPAPVETKFWDSTTEYQQWLKKYRKKKGIYTLLKPDDVAKAVLKASRKNQREILVPKWWTIYRQIHGYSIWLVEYFMMRIEKGKKEINENKPENV